MKWMPLCRKMVRPLLVATVLAMSVSSCMEKDVYVPTAGEEGKVTLDNYFDFATTKSVQLNIDYGKDCSKAYFEVYAENPLEVKEGQVVKRTGLMHIASGFTDKDGVYNSKASIPASVSQVYIYSPDFGIPTLFATEVAGDAITAQITFDNEIELSSIGANSRTATTRAISQEDMKKVIPLALGGWNNSGKPDYLSAEHKITIDETLKSYITSSFPDSKDNSKSIFITNDADITIYKKANVVINYFGGDTGAQSVFAYYCYAANASQEEIKAAAKNACVIFPNAHGSALGKYSGVGVALKYINAEGEITGDGAFPANTKIGFLIWNNGWVGGNNGVFVDNAFYSTRFLNKEDKSYTAVFGAKNKEGESFNVITMEDWGSANNNDYNDVAFVITSDPIDAIVVPPGPDPKFERTGTDTYRGLLCFEDSWPLQGDYDMNDVVLKYASNVNYNYENNVIDIEDKFTLTWTGADFKNGFAYEVPYDLTDAEVVITGGNASATASGRIITLFADAKAELGVANVSASGMSDQNVEEVTYTVSIKFKDPSIHKSNIVSPYNPFIKIRNSATEVHLTDFPPTAGAANEFPSGSDISTGDGKYFISEGGFPFAVHMDARIDQSLLNVNLKPEKVRIDVTYPGFGDWAKTRNPQIKWW